ncbi:MAG: RimK family alpha-L-glutamate ligase [Myxococcaceae bacterium]
MRVVVLSRSSRIASTSRLIEAARARGHHVRCVDPTSLQLQLGARRGRLVRAYKLMRTPDLVIPRFAGNVAPFALPMVDQLEAQGAVVMNGADAIGVSRNLLRCLQRLSSRGVPVPRTVLARDSKALKSLVSRVGGLPVVVKLLAASEQRRVMLCESMQSLEAALEAVLGLGHDVVMQESIRQAQRDLQLLVVGGRVTAAVHRIAQPGRAARNLGQFDRIERATPSDEVRSLAERAAKACGLELCSVDVIEGKWARVADVNALPSLPELEIACERDLATEIIERGEQLVAARAPKSKS